MTFHEHLMYLRKQKGFSQEQLGAKVGVSRQTVSKWELGDTTPELEKLIQLSELFNISIDELIGRDAADRTAIQYTTKPCGGCYPWLWHYEYKSKRTLRGIPLVHINIGRGPHKAKGIVAIGMLSRGVISIGLLSAGLLSLGPVSLGLLSFGAVSLGLILSAGAISIGTIALGGLALGIFAAGGCAIGVYAMGGCAVASKIAAGGFAKATIAIGDKTSGQICFDIHESIPKGQIYRAICGKFPGTWKFIANLFDAIP